MATLTLEIPPEVYHRLREEADRVGKPLQSMIQEWLVERLAPPAPESLSNREEVRQALRDAGLWVELSPSLRRMADPTVCLEDVEAALGRVGGESLSDIVLEQRGPKG